MEATQTIPFYHPKNFYEEDPYFPQLIRSYLSPEEMTWAEKYLRGMGKLSAQEISPRVLPSDQNPPTLRSYDFCGRRIDQIEYHESYREMARRTYEFGIIGLGYSEEFKKEKRFYGPLLKFGIGYLFSQAGSVLYCPICMTDGTLQILKQHASKEIQDRWIPRITSMNYETFADGGMYLTEAQGGSDVGANTCRAYQENGQWKLEGKKWFCSNAGSATALVLARPDGAPGGTAGLGLFLVPNRLENGQPNGVQVDRIKPKLGTCEMATAEITFEGSEGYLIGDLQEGFSYMTEMLNLSRTYNAVWSIGLMQRAFLEARYYAEHRMAFGQAIREYPLVDQTIRQMETDSHRALGLVLEALSFMDRLERGQGSQEDEILLRLLTPIIKYYTAEKCIEASHRAIEIFGGNGCIEDFPVAKMLRDAQILAIWEGTANILALDLLRVLKKSQGQEVFLKVYHEKMERELGAKARDQLKETWTALQRKFDDVVQGRDGFGGRLECRNLGVQLAQFLESLVWIRNQGK